MNWVIPAVAGMLAGAIMALLWMKRQLAEKRQYQHEKHQKALLQLEEDHQRRLQDTTQSLKRDYDSRVSTATEELSRGHQAQIAAAIEASQHDYQRLQQATENLKRSHQEELESTAQALKQEHQSRLQDAQQDYDLRLKNIQAEYDRRGSEATQSAIGLVSAVEQPQAKDNSRGSEVLQAAVGLTGLAGLTGLVTAVQQPDVSDAEVSDAEVSDASEGQQSVGGLLETEVSPHSDLFTESTDGLQAPVLEQSELPLEVFTSVSEDPLIFDEPLAFDEFSAFDGLEMSIEPTFLLEKPIVAEIEDSTVNFFEASDRAESDISEEVSSAINPFEISDPLELEADSFDFDADFNNAFNLEVDADKPPLADISDLIDDISSSQEMSEMSDMFSLTEVSGVSDMSDMFSLTDMPEISDMSDMSSFEAMFASVSTGEVAIGEEDSFDLMGMDDLFQPEAFIEGLTLAEGDLLNLSDLSISDEIAPEVADEQSSSEISDFSFEAVDKAQPFSVSDLAEEASFGLSFDTTDLDPMNLSFEESAESISWDLDEEPVFAEMSALPEMTIEDSPAVADDGGLDDLDSLFGAAATAAGVSAVVGLVSSESQEESRPLVFNEPELEPASDSEVAQFSWEESLMDEIPMDESSAKLLRSLQIGNNIVSLPQLRQLADHADAQVRQEVAEHLIKLTEQRKLRTELKPVIPVLGRLSQDAISQVRTQAVQALGQIQSFQVLPFLRRALKDASPEVTQAAAIAIRQVKPVTSKAVKSAVKRTKRPMS